MLHVAVGVLIRRAGVATLAVADAPCRVTVATTKTRVEIQAVAAGGGTEVLASVVVALRTPVGLLPRTPKAGRTATANGRGLATGIEPLA